MSWAEAADAAQRVLADRFWHPLYGIYQRRPGRRRLAIPLEWSERQLRELGRRGQFYFVVSQFCFAASKPL